MGYVHVVAGKFAAESVRAALRLVGVDAQVVALTDPLNVGPLWDLESGGAARLAFFAEACSHESSLPAHDVHENAAWSAIRAANEITVWYGPAPFEYFVPVRLAAALGDRAQLFEIARPADGRRPHRPAFYDAVNLASPTELAELTATKRPLEHVAERAAMWQAMTASRTAIFREVREGKLVELPADGRDERILNCCGGDWTPTDLVIAHVIADIPVSDVIIAWRIRALVEQGVLEGREAGRYGVADVRRRA